MRRIGEECSRWSHGECWLQNYFHTTHCGDKTILLALCSLSSSHSFSSKTSFSFTTSHGYLRTFPYVSQHKFTLFQQELRMAITMPRSRVWFPMLKCTHSVHSKTAKKCFCTQQQLIQKNGTECRRLEKLFISLAFLTFTQHLKDWACRHARSQHAGLKTQRDASQQSKVSA